MNKTFSKLLAIMLVATIVLGAVPLIMPVAKAVTPPAVWIVPDTLSFTTGSPPPGNKFNVTVYAGTATDVFAYQVYVTFNTSQIKADRAGYTAGATSQWFASHSTSRTNPVLDNSTNPGSVACGETLFSPDSVPASSGSILWIEFEIIASPAPGENLTSLITPVISGIKRCKLIDPDGIEITPIGSGSATYSYAGPPAPTPKPPVAVFDYSPKPVVVGQLISFDGSASYATSGTIVSWSWDFGDNTTGSGNVVTHTYISAGTYAVNLTVTDNNALTNSTAKQLTVYAYQPAHLYVDPSQIIDLSMAPTSTFYINVTLTAITTLGICQFNLTYDPQVLNWIGIELMPVPQYPTATMAVSSGYLAVNLSYINVTLTGNPTPLVRVHFDVNAYGISCLNLTNISLLDSNGNPILFIESDGLFANIIRDVAVTNVAPALGWVYQGWTDDINVTVANLGNVTETFSVSALYDSSVIGVVSVNNLAPNTQTTVDVVWNTTGILEGNYTITGVASQVPYENYFDTANNVYVDGIVQVLAVIHDVAITNITPALSWAYVNSTVPVDVTASNLGNVSESFTVTAYYNGTTIGTLPVTNLAYGTSTVLTFNWNTTGIFTEGNYTISAQASTVPFEYNTTNNYLSDGQVLILTARRDVAITSVVTSRTWVYQGQTMQINVTSENLGDLNESFDVSAYYNSTSSGTPQLIGTQHISSLAPSTQVTVTFNWNTAGVPCHNYTITGECIIPYDMNMTNNSYTTGNVTVRIVGDINGDGIVDMQDISIVAMAFMTSPGDPRWNPDADINGDGIVDMMDIAAVAQNFMVTAPY